MYSDYCTFEFFTLGIVTSKTEYVAFQFHVTLVSSEKWSIALKNDSKLCIFYSQRNGKVLREKSLTANQVEFWDEKERNFDWAKLGEISTKQNLDSRIFFSGKKLGLLFILKVETTNRRDSI
jgi:hypothetical protein